MPLKSGTTRRRLLTAALLLLPFSLIACHPTGAPWHSTDVSDTSPDLAFRLTRAGDGRPVTQADYRGKVTLLYFGYTFCPDVWPGVLIPFALRGSQPIDDRLPRT